MEARVLSQHIVRRFDTDLRHLRDSVGELGRLVQAEVEVAIRAVTGGDRGLADYVESAHAEIERGRQNIEEECNRLIARRAPIASDLRLVLAALKAISDLERAGNEARKIAGFARELADSGEASEVSRSIGHLGVLAAALLQESMRSLIALDADAALQVLRRDAAIDAEYDTLQRRCMSYLREAPPARCHTIDVLMAARSLERIGDHAKNIAEYVVYVVYGKDVRHWPLGDVERAIAAREAAIA